MIDDRHSCFTGPDPNNDWKQGCAIELGMELVEILWTISVKWLCCRHSLTYHGLLSCLPDTHGRSLGERFLLMCILYHILGDSEALAEQGRGIIPLGLKLLAEGNARLILS